MTLGETALQIAIENLGKKEATGHNDGTFVSMLQRWVAAGESWLDGQPWCACFASWCVYQAGARLGIKPAMPKSASSTTLYAWFKNNGKLVSPAPGCIGLIKAPKGSGKTHKHTFFVESIHGNTVRGIDGNWKNAVSKSSHPINMCDFGEPS